MEPEPGQGGKRKQQGTSPEWERGSHGSLAEEPWLPQLWSRHHGATARDEIKRELWEGPEECQGDLNCTAQIQEASPKS